MNLTYAKLRGRIVEKFGTAEKFAEAIGLTTVTVSKKLNGKTSFKRDDIIKWGEILEIDESEFGAYFFS